MMSRLRRSHGQTIRFVLVSVVFILLAIGVVKGWLFANEIMGFTGLTPGTVTKLAFDTGVDLRPIDGRVNMLLLGIAGGDHDGPDLTDTILVLSFVPKQHQLAMISVPRDIWSDTLKDKINSAYHYGEEKKKGGGLVLAKATISDIVGLPIQYGVVFDFAGFKDIIDLVGGITINVPKAFSDSEYPIAGRENDLCGGDPEFRCRYETLRFDAGPTHMNGELALKYVRSRHAEGTEGSDFARGKRQQEMLVALKEKITSKEILQNVDTLKKLYAAFDKASDMDLNIGELLTIGKLFVNTKPEDIKKLSLEEQLYTPPSSWYGRFVLLPKDGFDALHAFVATSIK
jgi:LCP family protein required for cell wall assembly